MTDETTSGRADNSSIELERRLLDIAVWWFIFLTSPPVLILAFIIAYGGGYVPFEWVVIALLSEIFVEVYDAW